jgi:hypothetical protein
LLNQNEHELSDVQEVRFSQQWLDYGLVGCDTM